jgi:hypothetical protein
MPPATDSKLALFCYEDGGRTSCFVVPHEGKREKVESAHSAAFPRVSQDIFLFHSENLIFPQDIFLFHSEIPAFFQAIYYYITLKSNTKQYLTIKPDASNARTAKPDSNNAARIKPDESNTSRKKPDSNNAARIKSDENNLARQPDVVRSEFGVRGLF